MEKLQTVERGARSAPIHTLFDSSPCEQSNATYLNSGFILISLKYFLHSKLGATVNWWWNARSPTSHTLIDSSPYEQSNNTLRALTNLTLLNNVNSFSPFFRLPEFLLGDWQALAARRLARLRFASSLRLQRAKYQTTDWN